MPDDRKSAPVERRVHHEVRKIFVQACVLLAPYFKGNEKVPAASSFAMLHMVNAHFPGLSSSEAHIVVTTAERLHREGRLPTLTGNNPQENGNKMAGTGVG